MRGVVRGGAIALAVVVSAGVSLAFDGLVAPGYIRCDVSFQAEGPAPGPGSRGPLVRQKIRLEAQNGQASVVVEQQGDGAPRTLVLDGAWRVTKSTPSLGESPLIEGDPIGFPITKVNGNVTKGSLKAGDDVYVPYRPALEAFLSSATLPVDLGPPKTQSAFLSGNMITSTLKQTGKLKVDRTFTYLSGAVVVKGTAYLQDGPYNGYQVKYTLKAKLKPPRRD